MKKFLKSYFLYAAKQPFGAAAWVVVIIVIAMLVFYLIFGLGLEAFKSSGISLPGAIVTTIILGLLNLIIVEIFITNFWKNESLIVLLRPGEDRSKSFKYSKPLWGKIPHVKILFPDDWDVNDHSGFRALRFSMEMPFKERAATIGLEFRFLLCGPFQAQDLEEMIRRQELDSQNEKKYYFRLCLRDILEKRLNDSSDVIHGQLMAWSNKKIKTREIEEILIKLSNDVFSNLFSNVYQADVKLLSIVL